VIKEAVSMANRTQKEESIILWMIEDDALFRDGIRTLIDRTPGFVCEHTFSNCEEALELLENGDVPRILLMDLGLPGMSGIEGMRKVKDLSPATDVLVLTIYDDDEKVFEAICAGASGYLLKSSSGEEIVSALIQLIQGGAPMNAQVARRVLDLFSRMAGPKGKYDLSRREKEVLHLLVEGLSKRQIADRLFVSFYTIDTHLKNIYEKLHVHTRSGVVAKALRERLI
jgi:DNA-binding NarL/FixJ family response regulator